MQLVSGLPPKEPAPASDVEFSQAKDRQQIAAVWEKILPQVRRGLQFGQGDGTTPEAMLYGILAGDYQLWVAHKGEEILAGIVVSIGVHVTGKKVVVQLAGGKDIRRWLPRLLELLEGFRKQAGAMCVETSCRPGVARILKQHGCRQKAIIMEM